MEAVNLLVALFLCLCTLVQAQDYTASAQYYGPEIGLAYREVNAVFQGRQGFMWFGIKFGSNKFDGICFTPYTQQVKGLILTIYNPSLGTPTGCCGSLGRQIRLLLPSSIPFDQWRHATKNNSS